jgi:hypothetical protein
MYDLPPARASLGFAELTTFRARDIHDRRATPLRGTAQPNGAGTALSARGVGGITKAGTRGSALRKNRRGARRFGQILIGRYRAKNAAPGKSFESLRYCARVGA